MDGKREDYFGQYLLIKKIEEKGASVLWSAINPAETDRPVTLKILSPQSPPDLFEREVRALQRLDHKCILRMFGSGSVNNVKYLVFEPLDGISLRGELYNRGGSMGIDSALPILLDILSGLEHIHSKQVYHLNLKPNNIFIFSDGTAKLTNFSIAKVRSLSAPGTLEPVKPLGYVAGSRPYMAPEQLVGRQNEDSDTDLYAFGLLLFRMLTGEMPFNTQITKKVLAHVHLQTEPPSLIAFCPEIPEALESIYRRLVTRRRKDRYHSAGEVSQDIVKAVSGWDRHKIVTEPDQLDLTESEVVEVHEEPSYHLTEETFITDSRMDSVIPQERLEKSISLNWNNLNTQVIFGEESISPERIKPPSEPVLASHEQAGAQDNICLPTTLKHFQTDDPGATRPGNSENFIFPVGTILSDRYYIEEHLAQGGFGNIYLATEIEDFFPEKIVLKVPISEADPDELYKRLRSQLKKWGLLSKKEPERVVRLLGVKRLKQGEGRVVVGIFMEYMGGGNLLDMVRKDWEGFPRTRDQLAQLIRLILQVCLAVQALHSNELLHRDIKPANMLLDSTKTKCKISDFELVASLKNELHLQEILGTLPYMAPECLEGNYSIASDVFALGATVYHLLSGKLPFDVDQFYAHQSQSISNSTPTFKSRLSPGRHAAQRRKQSPEKLEYLNPLVPPELSQIVMRCLEPKPEHRPPSVDDFMEDIIRLGLTGDGANAAPVNLARLLITHLGEEDRAYLVKFLERGGFRSARHLVAQEADLIEEYCYTAPPDEVLALNCTMRQLAQLAGALGLELSEAKSREEVIEEILAAVGFRSGPRQVPGIEKTRGFLDDLLLNVSNATTTDECIGMAHSGIAAIERTIDLLVRFYGQLVYGSALNAFLTLHAQGKPAHRLTLGQKINALEDLCFRYPAIPLSTRVSQVFKWPIFAEEIFEALRELKNYRNELAHRPDFGGFHKAQLFTRKTLSSAVEFITRLAANRYVPRVVQIISRQDDIYGRHFYIGQDDRLRSERIFTPLPLEVGQLYLFFPLTNPARINPLIFPYDVQRQDETSGKASAGKSAERNHDNS